MPKIRVGVLRGGPSHEYETSLKSGATVLQHLPQESYEVLDIFIARDCTWHRKGIAAPAHDVLAHLDVVFNALHGHYGEDGKVQHFLELHKIPFTGSYSFASALGSNPAHSKAALRREGIKTPYFRVFEEVVEDELPVHFKTFSPPVVVMPVSPESTAGRMLANTPDAFREALIKAFENSDRVIMEEHIPGILASVGVIDGYRDSEHYALPAVEGGSIVPGNFTPEVKAELEDLAKRVHKVLGLRHYSKVDFVISPRRGIFVLEVSPQPEFTEDSPMAKALHSVGAPLGHFFDHLVQLALGRK